MFSSRPPFNDDPYPNVWNGHSPRNQMRVDTDMYRRGAPYNHESYSYKPRPEFGRPQHNPTNPILEWFRAVLEDPKCGTFDQVLDDFLIFHIKGHGRHEHHARKVLTRLASLTKEETA
jgi:hypothetical protein